MLAAIAATLLPPGTVAMGGVTGGDCGSIAAAPTAAYPSK